MIDLKIAITSDGQLESIRRELQQLPKETYDYFRSITPIRSGNARRRTRLQGNTIQADYAYAQALDQGHSKQAPQGMVTPTERWLQRRLKQITGN